MSSSFDILSALGLCDGSLALFVSDEHKDGGLHWHAHWHIRFSPVKFNIHSRNSATARSIQVNTFGVPEMSVVLSGAGSTGRGTPTTGTVLEVVC